jgi:D-alanyl-lipoteichoic acid acyltransferase DltB (MBOAT superfamily)
MFPELVAGPIIRYHKIARQLAARSMSRQNDIDRTLGHLEK